MTLEQACPSEYQRAQCAFKDSMTHWNSAIRITYRISLRSSSMPEPRDPLLKVLFDLFWTQTAQNREFGVGCRRAVNPPKQRDNMVSVCIGLRDGA